MNEVISMSRKEAERVGILQRLAAREIRQRHAAKQLGISVRQAKRLLKAYRQHGAAGLVHKGRGRTGNRAIPVEEKDRMMALVQEQYSDFGPTLAWEKLREAHGCTHSDETIRSFMIAYGIWKPKQRKLLIVHSLRDRRECLGELVQADGSLHDWFEGRAPSCTLLVFIDDATGRILHLLFVPSESTQAYFLAMRHYLETHGRPMVLYVDKHGVFRVNTTKGGTASTTDSNGITQFGRAMKELDIGVIFANSAEAKGRVERVNQTLQDRLVKEMRLRGIYSLEEANRYLPEFMETFNGKFAVVPKSPANLHRPLLPSHRLDDILCLKFPRVLSKQLTVSYESKIYQVQTERPVYALRHTSVTVQENLNGTIQIVYKGQSLAYTVIKEQPKAEIVDSKHLNAAVDRLSVRLGIPVTVVNRLPRKPAMDHPWRRPFLTS